MGRIITAWCPGPLLPLRPPLCAPALAFPSGPVLRSSMRWYRFACACFLLPPAACQLPSTAAVGLCA